MANKRGPARRRQPAAPPPADSPGPAESRTSGASPAPTASPTPSALDTPAAPPGPVTAVPSAASPPAPADVVPLRGVRVRNLQGVDLEFPLRKLVAITGVSGSGKASLAFDTLFAEGRRRFVETLSTSARTLLAPLERPDADLLGGLPPAVAVRQRFAEVSPRPTIASACDITTVFRQLFSEWANVTCPGCDREVPRASPGAVARNLSEWPTPSRLLVLFELLPPHPRPAHGPGSPVKPPVAALPPNSPAPNSPIPDSPAPDAPAPRRSRRGGGQARPVPSAAAPAVDPPTLSPASPTHRATRSPASGTPTPTPTPTPAAGAAVRAPGAEVSGRAGSERTAEEVAQRLRLCEQAGFARFLVEGVWATAQEVQDHCHAARQSQRPLPRVLVVVDRLTTQSPLPRLRESCEQACRYGQGHFQTALQLPGPEAGDSSDRPDPAVRAMADGTWWRFAAWTELRECPTCRLVFDEPEPRLFSDNHPQGACPRCQGVGRLTAQTRPDRRPGLPPGKPPAPSAATPMSATRSTPHPPREGWQVCPDCAGGRLRDASLAWRWRGETLPAWLAKSAQRLSEDLPIESPTTPPGATGPADPVEIPTATRSAPAATGRAGVGPDRGLVEELRQRLTLLNELGLGLAPLATPLCELTASETQRARLAGVLATDLVHLLFVLEEPSAGLLPEQWPGLIRRLRELTDCGNSVVLIEQQAEVLAACDWVIELGPGSGSEGGRVLSAGPLASPVGLEVLTRAGGAGRPEAAGARPVRRPSGRGLLVWPDEGRGSPEIPLGGLTLVQGPAALAVRPFWLEALQRVLSGATGGRPHSGSGDQPALQLQRVGQRAPGRTRRALVAGVLGVWPEIRQLFAATTLARELNFGATHFGLVAGGPGCCESCGGLGVQIVDLQFLPDLESPCPACRGRRFCPPVLEVCWRGENIAGVLELTLREALPFFKGQGRLQRRLKGALDLGLGALRLGQACRQLATGEALRLNLAATLAGLGRGNVLLVLEEPGRGLHTADLQSLQRVLDQSLTAGHTVLVFDQDPRLRHFADRVVWVEPESGPEGAVRIRTLGGE